MNRKMILLVATLATLIACMIVVTRHTSARVGNDATAVEVIPPINLADGDVGGLAAAIQNANSHCDPATTINLAPGGTYTLTSIAENPREYNAPQYVGLPVIRVSLTINGNGATIRRSTAPGTPDFTVLAVSGRTEGGPPSCYAYPVLTLNQTTLTGGSGGGLHINSATALVQSSTITQNTGGGGINNSCGTLNLLNSTVSYNTTDNGFGGGGIFSWNFSCAQDKPVTNISFSTIFENQARNGDSIATAYNNPGSVVVKNSILASPTRANSQVCWISYGDSIVSAGHNVLGDNSCSFANVGDMQNTNPLLGPLASNDGLTPNHLPLCNSPDIDAVQPA